MTDLPVETATVDATLRPASLAATAEARHRTQAAAALAGNTAFLGLSPPTAGQVGAQVQALTRQVNALIRLVLAGDLLVDDPDT